jgi:hypothetical protein
MVIQMQLLVGGGAPIVWWLFLGIGVFFGAIALIGGTLLQLEYMWWLYTRPGVSEPYTELYALRQLRFNAPLSPPSSEFSARFSALLEPSAQHNADRGRQSGQLSVDQEFRATRVAHGTLRPPPLRTKSLER